MTKIDREVSETPDITLEDALKIEDIKLYKQNRKQRSALAWWTFVLITAWLFFVGVALYIVARQSHLSDIVLCTLLTTTTANVLGLPFIILRGLFKTNL